MSERFSEQQWGALRSAVTTKHALREKALKLLSALKDIFDVAPLQNVGMQFEITPDDPNRIGYVRTEFGTAEIRLAWKFFSPEGQGEFSKDQLVGRVVALCSDPLDLSDTPKTLPPVWEAVVSEYGEPFVELGDGAGHLIPFQSSFGNQLSNQLFIVGMDLHYAIANRAA